MPETSQDRSGQHGVCPTCHAPFSSRGHCAACVLTRCMRENADIPDATPLFEQIGDHQIIETIARGGMGIVFKARQRTLNRIVAIKMLAGGKLANVEAVERFRAEAAAIARLRHPGIVTVHETGRHEGHYWFSMDFVDGPSLVEIVKDGPLDPQSAVEYLRAIAEAVEYAHQQGVLHRDLKPSNILIDPEGHPHVTDFGLTREVGGDSDFTATGQVIGTPGYLPPEQATGKREAFAPSCDVYGLGATLYHLLTGRPPFASETLAATFRQVLHDEPVRPSKLNPRINAELETICLKCLEKEPARRYSTARELAGDLGRWLRHEPILARPGNAAERLVKWARRHRALALAYLGCAILLLAMLAVLVIDNARVHRSQRDAKLRLAEVLVEQARAIRLTGQAGQSREALRLLHEAAASHDLSPALRARLDRTWIAALAQPDVQRIVPPGVPPVSDFMHVAFDPSFERAVVPGERNRFSLLEIGGTNSAVAIPRRLSEADQVLGFSANGRFVAFRSKDRTEVWDTVENRFCIGTNGSRGAAAFLAGGRQFARGEEGGRVVLYDFPSGAKSSEWRPPGFGILSAIAASADGTNLILGSASGAVECWRVGEVTPRWRCELQGGTVALACSAGLGQITCLTRGDHLVTIDLNSGRILRTRVLPVDESSTMAYSPDDTVLAVGHQQDGVWLLDAPTGAILLRNPARTWGVTFSRDGRRIGPVWERGRIGWLEYQPSKVLRQLQPDSSPAARWGTVFSPGGRWLASLSGNSVHIWESATGRRAQTISVVAPYSADWSPHHGTLATANKSGVTIWMPANDATAPLHAAEPIRLLDGKSIHAVRFSPCGRWFAAANPVEGTLHIFNITNWQPVATLGLIKNLEWSEFTSDGETIVAGSEDPPQRLWWHWQKSKDPLRGDIEPTDIAASLRSYSPDGRYSMDVGDALKLHRIQDSATGIILPLGTNNVQFAATFREDGRLLAATQNDSEIHLIDLDTRLVVHVLEGLGNSRVRALTFDPTGRYLAAQRERGEVQLWDLHEMELALRELAAEDESRRLR